ncbi:MAG TPA: hypothetical protein VMT19_04765 [Thermoanaerobaculaceae bacterium]|nr:hypothetical protein [Thermoanaerobaculaceae bacterium]
MRVIAFALLGSVGVLLASSSGATGAGSGAPRPISAGAVTATVTKLIAAHGEAQAERIRRGVEQVAQRWWSDDGDEAAFEAFCTANFISRPAELAATFARLEAVLEQVDGHLHEVRRELLRPTDLDTGPIAAVDRLLANLDLSVHTDDDLFKTKVAFLALLNFPVDSLSERLGRGSTWNRQRWAESRMMDRFAERAPAAVLQGITESLARADRYIDEYNIRMDRLVTPDGKRLFPEGLRLISHWGLRDELASHYGEPDGLAKQRAIQRVMERIVRQEIPVAVIDNPGVEWCPETNVVRASGGGAPASGADLSAREPDTRYAVWLGNLRAVRALDAYTPTAPTAIARSFEIDRQIPENEVEALFVSVLGSAEVSDLAGLIAKRLGRPLEPFDIWYSGFKSRASRPEADLDRLVGARYPTVAAFQQDLPGILGRLGFAPEKARWIAERIVVDPSRGAGHAMGAVRREDKAHLRTRVGASGMDYKGYNIAVHEFGHNVEQTFSLAGIDHWFLAGVPNNAFTEALAMTFQDRDLELLGVAPPADAREVGALGALWASYEIAGVALVDVRAWHWLYDHPEATPAELREAVLAAARDVWNRYYAPVFGRNDVEILAIYSHMVSYPLYLSDYPLGHIIAFQLGEKLRGPAFGAEFERVARQGRLTPDLWMRGAVGGPISTRPLLDAARKALDGAR